MSRLSYAFAAVVLSALCGHSTLFGQAPATPTDSSGGAVIGTGTFTGFVENMDRSLAFYHDAFGMDVPALPASGARPYNPPNPQLFKWFDIAGARERHQSARVPGSRVTVELMEIQDVDHKTIPLRIQDPGAATLVLMVRDVDAIYTDAWTSMGHERETEERARIFPPYQVNDELMAEAAPHALFMHCLPAHRNEEVTDSVIDSVQSVVYDQAENRMHVQKAILMMLVGGRNRLPLRSAHA